MGKIANAASSVWRFYRDSFREMTWGRPLVWLILLKLFILFAVLRVFFFKPAFAGMTEQQKSEAVGERLIQHADTHVDTLDLLKP
ncbi:MAG: DUF4492 domain-containing protein [Bacteroidales bacterium]|nr:DUF4492 domain-containing protein [Bacteroidales bacterium]